MARQAYPSESFPTAGTAEVRPARSVFHRSYEAQVSPAPDYGLGSAVAVWAGRRYTPSVGIGNRLPSRRSARISLIVRAFFVRAQWAGMSAEVFTSKRAPTLLQGTYS